MAIYLDLAARHAIAAANAHYYKMPTAERYIDRTLPFHDFIYLIDGSWAITENEQEYALNSGDVMLLTAGNHHYTHLPCAAGTRTFCIHVTCLPGDRADCPTSISLPTLMPMQGRTAARHYFEEIVSVYWSSSSYKNERLSALCELLILELANEESQRSPSPDNLIRIANSAIELLTASPHRRFRTQEMAQRLFVSEKTLNNAMRKKTGMSFYAYEKNLKLEMIALQLETEPQLSVQELAVAFDFCDQFHLSKAFKQKYGMSPAQYRQTKQEQHK